MWTFPLGKKTQLFIQKTERFANIEFGLISFQFRTQESRKPRMRDKACLTKKNWAKKIPLIYQPYTEKISFTDRSTSCLTFAAAAM